MPSCPLHVFLLLLTCGDAFESLGCPPASSPAFQVDLSGLATREQRMAFFINIYNALVVHALVVFGAADSSLSRCALRGGPRPRRQPQRPARQRCVGPRRCHAQAARRRLQPCPSARRGMADAAWCVGVCEQSCVTWLGSL